MRRIRCENMGCFYVLIASKSIASGVALHATLGNSQRFPDPLICLMLTGKLVNCFYGMTFMTFYEWLACV